MEGKMYTMRYFGEVAGETIELHYPRPMANEEFAARFPGVKARPYDGYHRMVSEPAEGASRELFPILRAIRYKAAPSKHRCDARCLNATGRTMNCECACGGKNHGRGTFKAEAV